MEAGVDALVTVLSVIGAAAAVVAATLVGGWLDRRAATEREHALDDLRRYGPLTPGLRVELLPPTQRAQVLAARRQAGLLG
jgi:hypothetical protein